jgi:structural maintenance of chromosome 2
MTHEIERFNRDKDAARDMVEAMLAEHDWIVDQEQNFGKLNTAFDFSSQNPSECRKRLRQLEQEHEALRKKINVKVMNMIDRYALG